MTTAGNRFPNVDTISSGDVVVYRRKAESGYDMVEVRITSIDTHPQTGATVVNFEPV